MNISHKVSLYGPPPLHQQLACSSFSVSVRKKEEERAMLHACSPTLNHGLGVKIDQEEEKTPNRGCESGDEC